MSSSSSSSTTTAPSSKSSKSSISTVPTSVPSTRSRHAHRQNDTMTRLADDYLLALSSLSSLLSSSPPNTSLPPTKENAVRAWETIDTLASFRFHNFTSEEEEVGKPRYRILTTELRVALEGAYLDAGEGNGDEVGYGVEEGIGEKEEEFLSWTQDTLTPRQFSTVHSRIMKKITTLTPTSPSSASTSNTPLTHSFSPQIDLLGGEDEDTINELFQSRGFHALYRMALGMDVLRWFWGEKRSVLGRWMGT
ncbi:hypothetical protein B0J11DRAFT_534983 [Dendryphion nanum]|uniref:Uncharacterized protein n=1 Tax=Dendryphion nanum TaxID=256645 RepID=A0A9P9DIV1_9PLEO|nr:hypothetical protein B0J11DRAFT_534983 [Dendryphion nanum]